MSKKWVAFFSQTGNEIVNLTKALNKNPYAIVSNRSTLDSLDIMSLFPDIIYVLPDRPHVEDYWRLLDEIKIQPYEFLGTLHGYLRIIPKEICEAYDFINLHPGLINVYPDLKGIHPQKKAVRLQHELIGCVIHKVTSIVDDGEIILSSSTKSFYNLEDNQKILKQISLNLWIQFLNSFHD